VLLLDSLLLFSIITFFLFPFLLTISFLLSIEQKVNKKDKPKKAPQHSEGHTAKNPHSAVKNPQSNVKNPHDKDRHAEASSSHKHQQQQLNLKKKKDDDGGKGRQKPKFVKGKPVAEPQEQAPPRSAVLENEDLEKELVRLQERAVKRSSVTLSLS